MAQLISRSDLRFNFLKNIIVRIDFHGVLEAEMEKVLACIKPYAKQQGFSRYVEKNANQIEVAIRENNLPNSIEATNQVRSQKVYSFINEDRGTVLDVSNSFICLSIKTTHYTPFEEYRDIVPTVSKIYRETIDFFTVVRLGIRKINECLIKDKTQINRYFDQKLFCYYDQIDGVNAINSNHLDTFTVEQYYVNLLTNIAQGTANGETLYNIRLDIDVYLDKTDAISLLLANPERCNHINDLIFNIYCTSLTDELLSLLAAEEFDNSILIGVESND